MRLYDLSCDRCGWKAPMPVDEQVKDAFLAAYPYCRTCEAADGTKHKRTVKERIVVGVITKYLPFKDFKGAI